MPPVHNQCSFAAQWCHCHSIKVLNSTVADGKRTVVMTRLLNGLTKQHHTFSPTQLSIDFITALGSSPTFGYHKSKTVGTIALWPKTPSATAAGVAGYFRVNKAAGQQMRNNYNGEVGYQITPRTPLTVLALGRALPAGAVSLKGPAAVNIWSVATKKLIATGIVGPQNASPPEAGFTYGPDLATPLVLEQGQEYYVTQTCHEGMPDEFTNSDANAGAADQRIAAIGTSIYSGSPGVFPTIQGHGSQFAGVATFKTKVPANPHPPPVRTPRQAAGAHHRVHTLRFALFCL